MIKPVTNEVLTTPAGLTAVLRRNGHLKRGSVAEISIRNFHSYLANFYRLDIAYSSDAAPALPARMILKVPFADSEAALDMGREEVFSYRKLYETMPGPPIVRCFDASAGTETECPHLLLEDLSPTHFRGDAPDDITLRQWESGVEALACLHAFWWESEALGTEMGRLFNEADIEFHKKLLEESLGKFFVEVGGGTFTGNEKNVRKYAGIFPRLLAAAIDLTRAQHADPR
jgi:hypothetical protein